MTILKPGMTYGIITRDRLKKMAGPKIPMPLARDRQGRVLKDAQQGVISFFSDEEHGGASYSWVNHRENVSRQSSQPPSGRFFENGVLFLPSLMTEFCGEEVDIVDIFESGLCLLRRRRIVCGYKNRPAVWRDILDDVWWTIDKPLPFLWHKDWLEPI